MDYFIDQLRDEYQNLTWDEVYSLIEFVAARVNQNTSAQLESEINNIFFEEGAQYEMVSGKISQLMSPSEAKEISMAQEDPSNPSNHLQKAVELYNMRPRPDYSNSIKESISAVESFVKEKTGRSNDTLGSILPKLDLHPSLKLALDSLYKWTNDEGGIRHSLKQDDREPEQDEARFMLVQCSVLINYLKRKL